MAFGVGDGFFKGMGCTGFVTCHGAKGESCAVFPCPPYDGVYAGWWTSGCQSTPSSTFHLFYWTGAHWERIQSHTPKIYEGYVWWQLMMGQGSCGWAYKIEFGNDVALFLVGEVPPSRIPCEMWSKEMIKAEKERIAAWIKVAKDDTKADVKEIRAEAKTEVAMIRGKAKIDIAAERAEYKAISTEIRARVKRELVDVRDSHNEYEAKIKAEYKAAKATSDSLERDEKTDVRTTGKTEIAEEKSKERDDIGNIRKQKDLDVAAEYQDRDRLVKNRYEEYERKADMIRETASKCVVL